MVIERFVKMNDSGEKPVHKRRKRYSGKYPRKFEDKYKEHNFEKYPEIVEHVKGQGRTPAGMHLSVLQNEVMECLQPKEGEIVVDCTVGYGGHAAEFLKRIGKSGKYIGFDVDIEQLDKTKQRLEKIDVPQTFYRSNFAGIDKAVRDQQLEGFDIIFADLGVSSMQIDDANRGMSFKNDGPLDMRMDGRLKRNAGDMLAQMSAKELAVIFDEYGDEEDAGEIASAIINCRAEKKIETTLELVDIIFEAKGLNYKDWKRLQKRQGAKTLHPAAKVFQALRIAVNDELSALKKLLLAAPYCLRKGGRIGIISFHSGEDRLVINAFEEGFDSGIYSRISEEPVIPSSHEKFQNPRSSSAKFRWAVKS
jgi:16S rRNA (cytosine1402-N4)-methyltransferase